MKSGMNCRKKVNILARWPEKPNKQKRRRWDTLFSRIKNEERDAKFFSTKHSRLANGITSDVTDVTWSPS
jgi:hypothetical protein